MTENFVNYLKEHGRPYEQPGTFTQGPIPYHPRGAPDRHVSQEELRQIEMDKEWEWYEHEAEQQNDQHIDNL
jgi:hypothetical protein